MLEKMLLEWNCAGMIPNELILCWITIRSRSRFQGVEGKILIDSLDIAENARLRGMHGPCCCCDSPCGRNLWMNGEAVWTLKITLVFGYNDRTGDHSRQKNIEYTYWGIRACNLFTLKDVTACKDCPTQVIWLKSVITSVTTRDPIGTGRPLSMNLCPTSDFLGNYVPSDHIQDHLQRYPPTPHLQP